MARSVPVIVRTRAGPAKVPSRNRSSTASADPGSRLTIVALNFERRGIRGGRRIDGGKWA